MKYLLLFLGIVFSPLAKGQDLAFGWAKELVGSTNINVKSLVEDDSGNVYYAGELRGTADFDPGPGVYELSNGAVSNRGFVSKLGKDGKFCWAFVVEGSQSSIDCFGFDSIGNMMLAIQFRDTIRIEFGNKSNYFFGTSTFNYAFCVLNSQFDLVWKYQPACCSQNPLKVEVISGCFYYSARYSGNYKLDMSSIGKSIPNVPNGYFIVKISHEGKPEWLIAMNDTSNIYTQVMTIKIDNSGNCLILVRFRNLMQFSINNEMITKTGYGNNDYMVVKLKPGKGIVWYRHFGNKSSDNNPILFLDPSNNFYLYSTHFDTLDVDPGPDTVIYIGPKGSSFYLLNKLDENATHQWFADVSDLNIFSLDMCFGNHNDFYLARGFVFGKFDIRPSGNTLLNTNGDYDIFIGHYNESGHLLRKYQIGGNRNDILLRYFMSKNGNLYFFGLFQDTVDFDPGIGTFNMVAENLRSNFILKLTPSFPTGIANQSKESEPFQLYPNPTSNNLTIRFNQPMSNASLKLSDIQGREVITQTGVSGTSHTMQLEGLSSGMYFMQLKFGEQTFTRKVVKAE